MGVVGVGLTAWRLQYAFDVESEMWRGRVLIQLREMRI